MRSWCLTAIGQNSYTPLEVVLSILKKCNNLIIYIYYIYNYIYIISEKLKTTLHLKYLPGNYNLYVFTA